MLNRTKKIIISVISTIIIASIALTYIIKLDMQQNLAYYSKGDFKTTEERVGKLVFNKPSVLKLNSQLGPQTVQEYKRLTGGSYPNEDEFVYEGGLCLVDVSSWGKITDINKLFVFEAPGPATGWQQINPQKYLYNTNDRAVLECGENNNYTFYVNCMSPSEKVSQHLPYGKIINAINNYIFGIDYKKINNNFVLLKSNVIESAKCSNEVAAGEAQPNNLQKSDILNQLDSKAHELLCAENNKDMESHERAAVGYGGDIYYQYYDKVRKEFTDLQAQYRLKTGLDYPVPQLTSPPTNCPSIK